jgi:uncharacterized ferritin-like protein (DUF455 family)
VETIEAWARHYVLSDDLQTKLAPPALPALFARDFAPERLLAPGRPPELKAAKRGERIPKPEGMREPLLRAKALHAFLHHELQAAELMCWAVLAFADAEEDFRRGLLRVCFDEIRHMNLYRTHIEALGCKVGDFGVRDWFWKRVPQCQNKLSFVAVMGMGLEAANLEYAPVFAQRFRDAGDLVGAEIQERIGREEVAHVKFGAHWFVKWTGGCDFDVWLNALPPPWSPMVLRGNPIAVEARQRAGMSDAFIAALGAYVPEPHGRRA